MVKKAIIVGASGLVGSCLLEILLREPGYDEILVLVRKEVPVINPKLKQLVVDFDKLEDYADQITGEAIFSCLGTTRGKTPDLTIYKKIDHDYPVQVARIGLRNGMKQIHLVSSLGADATSSNFYLKMKGETERDMINVGLPSTHIYQPSFITGDRKENRIAEKILLPLFWLINPLFFGGWKKYRSISAQNIASAMHKQSLKNEDGVFIYPSDKIKELS